MEEFGGLKCRKLTKKNKKKTLGCTLRITCGIVTRLRTALCKSQRVQKPKTWPKRCSLFTAEVEESQDLHIRKNKISFHGFFLRPKPLGLGSSDVF